VRPLVKKALENARRMGAKVVDVELLENTLHEIGEVYRPGLIRQFKDNPTHWEEFLSLEAKVNEAAISGDREVLREALGEYKGFIVSMISKG